MAVLRLLLDRSGMREIAKDTCRGLIDETADRVAENARTRLPSGVEVTVQRYTTDRAAASVGIEDPLGMKYQAEDGVLTKAAMSAGLEVTRK